ncbi:MAG TPA: FG-GAP-like repeat-containing protein [Pyrinomonadaceae bacterium]|nr:FG-GAP-like repeat-containing protein [Pyrinomonadaceae bacterium]
MLAFLKTSFLNCLSPALTAALMLLLSQAIVIMAAGEIDPSFNAGVFRHPAGAIQTVVAQPDGKVLIGGNFEIANGVLRGGVVRLNTDGGTDLSFNPPSFSGTDGSPVLINAIAVQSNGKIIVAGRFSQIDGVFINIPVVRLNADGSRDAGFNLLPTGGTFTGFINDVDVRPDDKILIGGSFTYMPASDNATRNNLARLNPNGSADSTFTLNVVSEAVEDIAVQPDGKILGFNTSGSSSGNRFLGRLNTDGTVDASFNVYVTGSVLAIKVQPDGGIIIGGNFGSVNFIQRVGIARLTPDGGYDQSFAGSHVPVTIYDIEFAGDGKILVAGTFINYAGGQRNLIARLESNGVLDGSLNFNRNANGMIYSVLYDIFPLPNGQIIIGGDSLRMGNVGATVNRINSDGSLDNSFRTLLGNRGTVNDIAPLPNGQTVIGGVFGVVNTTIRPSLARLNVDGSLDTTFNPTITGLNQDALILAVTPLPDNKLMVGGQFLGMLARLNADGSTDPTFSANLSTAGPVYDIAVLPDGKIIGAGQITPAGSSSPRYVMKFNQDGSVDNSFMLPAFTGSVVRKVSVQPDGKILIAGSFAGIGGIERNNIARLNADGSLDTTFNPPGGTNNAVFDIARQADGKILIGGPFTIVNGESRHFIARLNTDGSTDTTFASSFNGTVTTIKVQPADGKILIGITFTSSTGLNRISRLYPDGSIDLSFNAAAGVQGIINTIELDAGGKILAGGTFVRYDNIPKLSIARLLNNAPRPALFDYDGNGRADISVFRPATGFWYIARPTGAPQNFDAVQFGTNGDMIVPADYDGDRRTDVAVWRPSDGVWYLMQSTAGFRAAQFGTSGDIPVPGDYDGDGKANLAVFRPSTGTWYIARAAGIPSQNLDVVQFGANGDKPIAGADFDGDGRADVAVFRPSTGDWYRIHSSNNQFVGLHFGIAEDKPVAADYDGDGRADIAVWRPSDGVWYRINSGTGTFSAHRFGVSQDRPAPADYDGDGRADFAVFRPSEGIWYLHRSTQGFAAAQFGAGSDLPTPNAFVR